MAPAGASVAISHDALIVTRSSGTFSKCMIVLANQNQVFDHWIASKLSHCQR
jgi:hypothetical protein